MNKQNKYPLLFFKYHIYENIKPLFLKEHNTCAICLRNDKCTTMFTYTSTFRPSWVGHMTSSTSQSLISTVGWTSETICYPLVYTNVACLLFMYACTHRSVDVVNHFYLIPWYNVLCWEGRNKTWEKNEVRSTVPHGLSYFCSP